MKRLILLSFTLLATIMSWAETTDPADFVVKLKDGSTLRFLGNYTEMSFDAGGAVLFISNPQLNFAASYAVEGIESIDFLEPNEPAGGGSLDEPYVDVTIDPTDDTSYTEVSEEVITDAGHADYGDFIENYTPMNRITITYDEDKASVSGKINGVTVIPNGAHVAVYSTKKNIGEIAIEYDEFGREVIKDTDQMLRSSSSYWKKQAENAGTTYSKLVVFASTAYGRITDFTLDASLKAMQQNKTALQVRSENNKKLVANEKATYDKIYGYADNAGKKTATAIGKSFIDIYGRADKATKSINNKLKWLYKEGKISIKEYTAYQKDLLSKNDSVWKKAIDSISAKWKQFANSGRGIGEAFRKGFLDEIKKIENTQIAMNPGQQGQWNKAKVTIEKMAEGGYPSMGSMFIAGEVPGQAEMVGNINGRTGVASGEEITGIAEAVYGTGETEAMLLRQLIAAVRSQNLTISPSASLGKVVNQSQRLYAGVTG